MIRADPLCGQGHLLVLFIGIGRNSHERIRENGDENCPGLISKKEIGNACCENLHDKEVTNTQEENQQGSS